MGTNCIWPSNGVAAGQEVFHAHVHVIPRWAAGGPLKIYPVLPQNAGRAELDDLPARLRASLEAPA
jgi:histidine triad (HIT) family protein